MLQRALAPPDGLVPVLLNSARLRERGDNQSLKVALDLGGVLA
ncbi:MAG: hypothetical protein VX293_04675 [Candidatus Latescibacterota bacterium]|nr:hypothetical protein [Candidatus Latescibacterota bacterium]